MVRCGWGKTAGNVIFGALSHTGRFSYHVIVIEETQGSHAVIISINPHHSLGGCCQRILQVALPSLVFIRIRVFLEAHPVILQKAHRPKTGWEAQSRRFISSMFLGEAKKGCKIIFSSPFAKHLHMLGARDKNLIVSVKGGNFGLLIPCFLSFFPAKDYGNLLCCHRFIL